MKITKYKKALYIGKKENISFCRNNIYFILVYNEGKNPDGKSEIKQEDSSKARISKYVHRKAKKKFVRFGLDRFEKIYFKEVFTYTESEFEKAFLHEIDDNETELPVNKA